jgi:paraquat-inducible protein B
MARKASPTLIGAFVLGAVVLTVVGLVLLGGGKLFRQRQPWVAHFDESIKGLAIGAPVLLNGVKVGAVTDIKIVIDQKTSTVRTPVYFEMEAERFTDATGARFRFEKEAAGTRRLIEHGLRAQLELSSLVTGQLAIQLDFYPGAPMQLVGVGPGEQEMPTVPSTTERLARTLEKLPLDRIAAAAQSALAGLERLVNSPDLAKTVESLPGTVASIEELARRVGTNVDGTLKDVRALARNVDGRIGPLAAEIDRTLAAGRETLRDAQTLVRQLDGEVVPAVKGTVDDARTLVRSVDGRIGPLVASVDAALATAVKALEETRATMGTVGETVADGSPLQDEVLVLIRDLSAAARSVRALSEYVEMHPESLVFGKNSKGGR